MGKAARGRLAGISGAVVGQVGGARHDRQAAVQLMRRALWGCAASVVFGLVVMAVCLGGALAGPPAARAASAAPAPAPSPTIVSEITKKETMYQTVYKMSDGSYQAQISAEPIRFKAADGSWQSFDTNLVSAGAAGLWQATNLPVALEIGTTGTGSPPVQIAARGYTLTWTVQGAAAGLATAPGPATASYLGVASDTTLSYKALDWGVEQSLSLASAAAPASFTCTLAHPGLSLAQDANGGWGLYAPGDPTPIYLLSGLSVYDAAGVPCSAATMTVSPGSGQSTLTYAVPRSWLSDSARVWPVTLDPSVTLNPNTGNTSYADTYVDSAGGTHGTATSLLCGYDGATATYNRTLVAFDLSSLGHAYVHSATFSLYKNYSGGSSPTIYTATMNEAWSTSSTWSSLGCVANSFPTSFCSAPIASQQVSSGAWMNVTATSAVSAWLNGSQANDGFVVYQTENSSQQGSAYESKFTSADAGGSYIPELVVNYDPSPTACPACSQAVYALGGTATLGAPVYTDYENDVTWIEVGLNLAKTDGSPYLGVVGWFASTSLIPAPTANWQTFTVAGYPGVFASYSDPSNPTDYGANAISLLPSGCGVYYNGNSNNPGYQLVCFDIKFTSAFGSQVNVTPDVRYGMGPAGVTTWASGSSYSGALSHPVTSSGWTAQPSDAFAVISPRVTTLTYAGQPSSGWFDAAGGAQDNVANQGRGALTLMWPAVSGASGYHIYLNDGSGSYRQVGATLGPNSTLWSSSGGAFYPDDAQIATLGSGSNPFYRGSTPTDGYSQGADVTPSTLENTITPSPAPSPTASPGDAVVLPDMAGGQYVYVHGCTTYGGPTVWTKIGTGHGGTTLGTNYGTVGPDISTIGGVCRSAFYLNGYLYDGATTAANANSATVVGVNDQSGATQNFTFTGGSPLNPATGSAITSNNHLLVLTSDVDASGVAHIYSIAYTLGTNGSGQTRFDGYRIREYTAGGAYVADHDINVFWDQAGGSELTYGAMADGNFLYLIAISAGDTAHVTKISTQTWQIVNQYPINQDVNYPQSGCYDPINDCFWLGAVQANVLYQYAGSGGTGNPAFDLRDNPNPLYQKTASSGAQSLGWTSYDFKVVPYTDTNNVSSDFAPPTPAAYELDATLDNRSYTANVDPAHTTAGLGSWNGSDLTARLDLGALQVDATDLAIDSYGPPAQVSRTYLASNTGSRFAPGWDYNFDAHLNLSQQGSGIITYVDGCGDSHQFLSSGSSWSSPSGFLGTLSQNGSGWQISYPDGTTDTYSSTGIWTSESDRNGNTTSYAWNAGNLTITAANGQSIQVSCNASGQITKATYTTSAGTREVDYTTASPWQVTYYPNSADARTVEYDYSSGALSAIDQLNWPSSGQTATESFSYNGNGQLSCVYFPDYNATSKPDARLTISYTSNPQASTASASISHYGTVGGSANQPTEQQSETWSTASGATAVEEQETTTSANSAEASTTNYSYAANNQEADAVTLASTSSDETTQDVSACSLLAGDVTAQSNSSGVGMQSLAYTDPNNPNLPTQVSDPLGTTTDSYDSNGNLLSTQRTLNASGNVSATQYHYNSQGLVTEQQQLVSGTPTNNPTWIETDYSSFYPNGSPGTTTVDGVQLSVGGASQNLTETATYDPFGDLLSQTDWSNSRVTETNTYDIAGNELTSTDAYGITTNNNYDCLGNLTSSWKSASGTSQKDDWTATTYDPMGRALTVTTYLSDSSGNPTTQNVTTNTWDGVGDELTSSASTMGGQPAAWTYDDQGHATSNWADGVYSYASGRGTQDSYDDNSNLLSKTVPGNTDATTYTYNPDGSLAQQNNPDGSFVAYSYDQNGNKTSQTVPTHGYSQNNADVATTNYTYDYGNRLTSTTEPNSFATTNTYDELGRLTGAQGSGNTSATNTTYNNLGWVLQSVDEDGVTDAKTYDTHGNVVSETIGSKSFTSTYNADDQLATQTDADGNVLTNTYDAFGNLSEAKHTNGTTTLKDIVTHFDSLCRPTSQTDYTTGLSHSWTYPTNSATGVQETINYDATPLTSVAINRNARNMETSRVATIGSNNTVTWAISDPSGRDNADRWVAATLQQTGGTQLSEGRSFDGAGRLSSQSGAGYVSGNSASYNYDPDTGLLAYESLPFPTALGGTVTEGTSSAQLAYDGNQRLTGATVNGVAGSYVYDDAGNLKQDTEGSTVTNFTYNGANQLTQSVTGSNTTVYGWDTTNAWRTSQGPSSNPNQIQYAYNAQGRMKSYTNSATGVSATYTYDAAGQRTKSAVTVGGVTTTTTWVYDGLTLMSQQVVSGSSSWRVDYLYNECGTPIGGVYRSPANSTSPIFFAMITNSHGDVCELLDTNGNAFAAYHYDAWGLPQGSGSYATGIWTASTSLISSALAGQIASEQVLRYAGYVYDPESGLYYCLARYYDPVTRQWTAADSAKADGEESPYQYCDGNPVMNLDSSGTYTYSPSDAVDYASEWYDGINHAYDYYSGDDCTNFVSQCLQHGGWPETGSTEDNSWDWFSHKNSDGSYSVSQSWRACYYWWVFSVINTGRAIPRAQQYNQKLAGNNACGGDVLAWFEHGGTGILIHLCLVKSNNNGDPLLYEHGDHDKAIDQPFDLKQAYKWMDAEGHGLAKALAVRIP